MHRFLSTIAIAALFFLAACNSTKQNTSNTMETAQANNAPAMLIDGNWEANYVLNSPKPFQELFQYKKPNVLIDSKSGKVSGNAGCNNFNGTVTIEKNKIQFGENMAVTRKACPDMSGEDLFLNTLKKVNSYSVTEQGKTLNLIMGDMAVMRLSRAAK